MADRRPYNPSVAELQDQVDWLTEELRATRDHLRVAIRTEKRRAQEPLLDLIERVGLARSQQEDVTPGEAILKDASPAGSRSPESLPC